METKHIPCLADMAQWIADAGEAPPGHVDYLSKKRMAEIAREMIPRAQVYDAALAATKNDPLDEALNMGDGSYRP